MLASVVCVIAIFLLSRENDAANVPVAGSVELALGAGRDVLERQRDRAAEHARAVRARVYARAREPEERRGDLRDRRHAAPVSE